MKTDNTKRCKYFISQTRKDKKQTWYVAAPPGYMRKASGEFARDGSFSGGPEWTQNRAHAHIFKSYLSAARVQGKCPGCKVHPLTDALLPLSNAQADTRHE
jgi:hypothetical protein